jgi:sulfotransferase family protein
MNVKRTRLRRSLAGKNRAPLKIQRHLSKYVPNSVKDIIRAVTRQVPPTLWELYRPIHGYFYRRYPKVLQTSIPKSGTHVLRMVLEKIGYRPYALQPFNPYIAIDYEPSGILPHLSKTLPGEYLIEHLTWQKQVEEFLCDAGFKILFIYRDPRATAVSWCHHMTRGGTILPFHKHYQGLSNLHSKITTTLEGIPSCSAGGVAMCPWPEFYDHFLPWKKSPAVFSVSFEDLIGSRGGGSDERQLRAIKGICDYLGCSLSHEVACRVAEQVFNPSVSTFRRGQIDAWRAEVDEATEAVLNDKLAKQLAEWGYK